MSTPELTVQVDRSGPDAVLVRVGGEIDLHTAPLLSDAVAEAAALDPAPAEVLIDLAAVGFLDSSAVNTLLSSRMRLKDAGIVLAVHAPADSAARRLIDLLGLTEPLRVTPPA
jgi:anti-anti-sigma factor